MILLYPKKYKGNQQFKSEIDVYYWDDEDTGIEYYNKKLSGLYDILVLRVTHVDGIVCDNWKGWSEPNMSIFTTSIDCRYQSQYLDRLLSDLIKIEEVFLS